MANKKRKVIVLTNINDESKFSKFGKFYIFNKSVVIEQNINEISDNSKISDYIKNNIIRRELELKIKDKKIDCLVYILEGTPAQAIKGKIQEDIYNKFPTPLRNSLELEFIILD